MKFIYIFFLFLTLSASYCSEENIPIVGIPLLEDIVEPEQSLPLYNQDQYDILNILNQNKGIMSPKFSHNKQTYELVTDAISTQYEYELVKQFIEGKRPSKQKKILLQILPRLEVQAFHSRTYSQEAIQQVSSIDKNLQLEVWIVRKTLPEGMVDYLDIVVETRKDYDIQDVKDLTDLLFKHKDNVELSHFLPLFKVMLRRMDLSTLIDEFHHIFHQNPELKHIYITALNFMMVPNSADHRQIHSVVYRTQSLHSDLLPLKMLKAAYEEKWNIFKKFKVCEHHLSPMTSK